MPLTLAQLNAAPLHAAAQMLDGLYEHSPWIADAALAHRPFASVAHLKHVMTQVLDAAGRAPRGRMGDAEASGGRRGEGEPAPVVGWSGDPSAYGDKRRGAF